MSNARFAESIAFILGSRDEKTLSCFCPGCALDRMRATTSDADEIVYVETVRQVGRARCSSCGVYPLVLSAQEALKPQSLLQLMGRVLKMAEREAKKRTLIEGAH